ncbi:transporter substrate-binding domain-containing protein [Endozoicomonas sp. 4G]|uniref:substrate-binding periplasmic protein n=1 Tax=Endozoicomonas sp. 4G TaxID=2872754 RepID=UPI002078DEC1|nr:transporter substrate-binding domain-containing protein [Endozoicomonas sp. 4G]
MFNNKKKYGLQLLIFCLLLPSALTLADEDRIAISTGLFPTNYPPLFWIDGKDGKKGIVQKILEAVSQRSNYDFVEEYYPFNRIIYKVGNGSLDLEAWSSPQWRERVAEKVYFTEPFSEHCEVIVQLKYSDQGVSQPSDLRGKRLGVVQNYTYKTFEPYFQSGEVIRNNSKDELHVLKLLEKGRSDAALMDELVAQHLMKTRFTGLFATGKRFDCVPVTFMFSKSAEQHGKKINTILQELKAEGVIDQILEEYL